jgi:hypothetical protein
MATITSTSNPTLHARLTSILESETVGWERPSYVMSGSTQYIVQDMADGTIQFTEVSSETMHDSTSDFPGTTP